jgi:hypothetical protein
VQRWIPVRIYAYLFPQDTAGVQGVFRGGYYLFGTPQDTAGAGVDRTWYTGGFFLFGMGQDTFVVQYYGRRDPVILGQDTAGAGVDRTYYGIYVGGFFLYGMGQDTFGVQSYPPKYATVYTWFPGKERAGYILGMGQDTADAGVDRTRYAGGFFLFGMGQDTVPPTTSVLAPPTYTVWTTQPIGYPVEGGIVLGEFTPTHVGLPIPVPESISANVRRGTQGEIVVTFTRLH